MKKVGYTLVFNKGSISEDFLEMLRINVLSFAHYNPGVPFVIFTLGFPLGVLKVPAESVRVIEVDTLEVFKGWRENIPMVYCARYHSSLLNLLGGELIGYFDSDIVHTGAAPWDMIQEHTIGVVEDLGCLKGFLREDMQSDYRRLLGSEFTRYYNSGVILFKDSTISRGILTEIYGKCQDLYDSSDKSPKGLTFLDQHVLNYILNRSGQEIQVIPYSDNVQTRYPGPADVTVSVFNKVLQDTLQEAGESPRRFHVFNFLASTRLRMMKYLASGYLPEEILYPQKKKGKGLLLLLLSKPTESQKKELDAWYPQAEIVEVLSKSAEPLGDALRGYSGRDVVLVDPSFGGIPRLSEETLRRATNLFGMCSLRERGTLTTEVLSFGVNPHVWPRSVNTLSCNQVSLHGLLLSSELLDISFALLGGITSKFQDYPEEHLGQYFGITCGILGFSAGFYPKGILEMDPVLVETPEVIQNWFSAIRKFCFHHFYIKEQCNWGHVKDCFDTLGYYGEYKKGVLMQKHKMLASLQKRTNRVISSSG